MGPMELAVPPGWLSPLPPAGGDAVFSCSGRREKERGPEIGKLVLGLWPGLRAGIFVVVQGSALRPFPPSFPGAPGLALPLVEFQLLWPRERASLHTASPFEEPSICHSQSSGWHLGWGCGCPAPGRSGNHMLGLHGSQMKP